MSEFERDDSHAPGGELANAIPAHLGEPALRSHETVQDRREFRFQKPMVGQLQSYLIEILTSEWFLIVIVERQEELNQIHELFQPIGVDCTDKAASREAISAALVEVCQVGGDWMLSPSPPTTFPVLVTLV